MPGQVSAQPAVPGFAELTSTVQTLLHPDQPLQHGKSCDTGVSKSRMEMLPTPANLHAISGHPVWQQAPASRNPQQGGPPVSQLIPLTLRQPPGSALVPVSEGGRARADLASPGRQALLARQDAGPRPSLKTPLGMPASAPQCCWTETPSVLHKPPRAACQCFPARSLAGWERQQAWHIVGWGEWV